jgi:hypothetical protein
VVRCWTLRHVRQHSRTRCNAGCSQTATMSVQGERQTLLDKKVDARTNITAEGKAKDELLDQHGSYVLYLCPTCQFLTMFCIGGSLAVLLV